METILLDVNTREAGSARAVKAEGMIPCVYYGLNKKNRNLSVAYQSFRKVYEKAGGNTILELVIDGKDKENVLVHDVNYDPVTDRFTHVDFIFIDLNKEITTEVPLVAIGESKAVREFAGVLMQNKDMLMVKCSARSIPHEIQFDISVLEDFHHSIHIEDLKLPDGVVTLDDPKLTVATVAAPRAEEEEAPPAEVVEAAVIGEEAKAEEKTEEKEKD